MNTVILSKSNWRNELNKVGYYLNVNDKTKFVKKRDSASLYNAPASFDIETTSTRDSDGNKLAIMYEWTFYIYNTVIIGRTWDQFEYLMDVVLVEAYDLRSDKYLVVWVHNLPFEFAFIKHRFNFIDTFNMQKFETIRATTDTGIQFRCSYALSGYSLKSLANEISTHKIEKLTEKFDYKLIRNSETILSEDEIQYCINDVLIVAYYIEEQIKLFKSIKWIPMTNTGRVRKLARQNCLYDTNKKTGKSYLNKAYREYIHSLSIEPDEYKDFLHRAFMGGYCHANALYAGDVLHDVVSYDLTSAYPAVMVSEAEYPVGKGKKWKIKTEADLEKIDKYAYVVDVKLTGLESKLWENYLSTSKCVVRGNCVTNNGRIVKADEVMTTVTNIDLKIIKMCYKYKSISFGDCYIYYKGHLPKEIVKTTIDLYNRKTKLKNVKGQEIEYSNLKSQLNSMYGLCVQRLDKPLVEYNGNDYEAVEYIDGNRYIIDDDYDDEGRIDRSIISNNESKGKFLSYGFGCWISALNRLRVWKAIAAINQDYVYSDTDSIKFINDHKDYFEKDNKENEEKMTKAMKYYNLPLDLINPEDIKGKRHFLGNWDYEGTYEKAKFIRAKTYILQENGELKMHVSGVSPEEACKYLKAKYGDYAIENFADGVKIPAANTGKLTHTYLDRKQKGVITDFQGHTAEYEEYSGVHLEPATFKIGLDQDFINFLLNVREYSL